MGKIRKLITNLRIKTIGGKYGYFKLFGMLLIAILLVFGYEISGYNNIFLLLELIPLIFFLPMIIEGFVGLVELFIIEPIKYLIKKK